MGRCDFGGDAVLQAEQLKNCNLILRLAFVNAGYVAEEQILKLPDDLYLNVGAHAVVAEAVGSAAEDARRENGRRIGRGSPEYNTRDQRAHALLAQALQRRLDE